MPVLVVKASFALKLSKLRRREIFSVDFRLFILGAWSWGLGLCLLGGRLGSALGVILEVGAFSETNLFALVAVLLVVLVVVPLQLACVLLVL